MNLIDYTGKLNQKDEYLNILKLLRKKSDYIEIVIIDGKKTNHIVETFKDDIILTKRVSKWWGTETRGSNYLYRIKKSKELFEYLSKFETFCKYIESDKGDYSEKTNFGIDDISFFDKNGQILLFTTTHEGYITIEENLIK